MREGPGQHSPKRPLTFSPSSTHMFWVNVCFCSLYFSSKAHARQAVRLTAVPGQVRELHPSGVSKAP